MELLLLILIVIVLVAAFSGMAGPTIYRRRVSRPVVHETVYEDEPVIRDEVVDEVPATRTRPRRVIEY